MVSYDIFTDGSTLRSNPSSKGSWGFTIWENDRLIYASTGPLYGFVTNTLVELKAVQMALSFVNESLFSSDITLYTDSKCAVNLVNRGVTLEGRYATVGQEVRHLQQKLKVPLIHVPRTNRKLSTTDQVSRKGLQGSFIYDTRNQLEKLTYSKCNYERLHTRADRRKPFPHTSSSSTAT